jgi:hypothetical protein
LEAHQQGFKSANNQEYKRRDQIPNAEFLVIDCGQLPIESFRGLPEAGKSALDGGSRGHACSQRGGNFGAPDDVGETSGAASLPVLGMMREGHFCVVLMVLKLSTTYKWMPCEQLRRFWNGGTAPFRGESENWIKCHTSTGGPPT